MGRIAIVDDEPAVAKALEALLSDGHEVEVFTDGRAFLQRFRTKPFEVVVLDLAMPVMDGLHVFRALRQISADVRVIALTGHDRAGYSERSANIGFSEFLIKPITDQNRFRQIVFGHIP